MAVQAGEVGKIITIDSGGYNLTGCTCTLVVVSPQNQRSTLPLNVDGGGLTASRATTAADFPIPGDWKWQLQVVTASSNTLLSPAISKQIGPKL